MKHRIFKVFLSFSIKADNTKDPKEVTVTLPEDSEVTAEDLKEQTITMTDKDKNVIEATFKEITEDGKVIFTAEKALEDAVEYKVTADWATFEKDTFTAQVKEAYVKNLAPASTVLLVEKATEENENKAKKVEIPVQAFDQYGKEIAMNAIADGAKYQIKKGSAFIGAMPLTDEEIEIDDVKETVTVEHTALKKGETIKFVVELVEKKDKQEVVKFEAPFVYDDLRDEEPIVDSVTLTTEGGTSLAYDEKVKDSESNKEIKLHADVRNQYNSKMNEHLRWVVNGEVQKDENGDIITDSTFSIASSEKPGEYKVQVFSTTDASKFDEVTITISDAPIRELTAETKLKNIEDEKNKVNEKIFNKEQLQLGTIEANEGAKLIPEQLKFEVIVTDDKLSKDDIQVTAEYAKDADGKETEEIIVKAKTDKAGTYKVIPYVGNSYTDKAAVKAENAFEVTTTVNPEIATIEEIKFDPTKLKLNQEIKEEIVIKNKHGERLTAAQVNNKVSVVSTKEDVVKAAESPIVQGTTDADKDKTYLVLKAGNTPGTAVVTVQSTENTSVLQTYTLDFVAAELAKVKLAQKTVKGVVAGDKEDKAQYNEVQFLDQHGLEIEEEGQAKVVDADGEDVTDVKAEVVKGAFNKEGNFVDADTAGLDKDLKDQVKQYVKVSAENATKAGNYTVIIAAKDANLDDEKTITGKFDVEVGAPRTVKDITLAPKSSTVATGAEAKVTVNLVDQYGEPYTLKEESEGTPAETLAVQLIDKKDETAVQEKVEYSQVKEDNEDKKLVPGAYEIVLPMDKSGDYELVVAFGKDDDKKSESVAIKVGQASELVDKVAITGEHVEGNKATVKLEKGKEMNLGLEAFDKDGNKVNIDAKEINWSSSNEDVATVVKGKDGKLTVTATDKDEKLKEDQKVTITADLKGKQSTVDIVVSAEDSKVQKDTLVATMKENGKDVEVTEVTIDEKAVDGKVALTFTAVDQYGTDLTITGEQFSILESMNSEVFTVAKPANGDSEVVITATGKGEANLRAKVDAEEVHVRIIVKEEAVVIAQDAETLAKALPKVKGVKKEKPLKIEGKDKNPSAKAVKEAVEVAIQAKENGIAVEVVNANDTTDVARSTQENVDGQGTEEEITTVEYKVTLSKGDAEKQELTVYAQFVLDSETEAANALEQAKKDAIAALKQQFPDTDYTGTGEGDAGNKEAYKTAMEAAETAINAAETIEAVNDAKGTQVTALNAIKTDTQLEKEANEEAAETALTKAKGAANKVELVNAESDVTEDSAKTAIEEAIKEALKDGENEEAFAGKVEVTVEENGFTAAENGTETDQDGKAGSIKFKITITVCEGDVEGKATSKEAVTLTITPKAFVLETEGSGEEGTSEGSQTEPGTPTGE